MLKKIIVLLILLITYKSSNADIENGQIIPNSIIRASDMNQRFQIIENKLLEKNLLSVNFDTFIGGGIETVSKQKFLNQLTKIPSEINTGSAPILGLNDDIISSSELNNWFNFLESEIDNYNPAPVAQNVNSTLIQPLVDSNLGIYGYELLSSPIVFKNNGEAYMLNYSRDLGTSYITRTWEDPLDTNFLFNEIVFQLPTNLNSTQTSRLKIVPPENIYNQTVGDFLYVVYPSSSSSLQNSDLVQINLSDDTSTIIAQNIPTFNSSFNNYPENFVVSISPFAIYSRLYTGRELTIQLPDLSYKTFYLENTTWLQNQNFQSNADIDSLVFHGTKAFFLGKENCLAGYSPALYSIELNGINNLTIDLPNVTKESSNFSDIVNSNTLVSGSYESCSFGYKFPKLIKKGNYIYFTAISVSNNQKALYSFNPTDNSFQRELYAKAYYSNNVLSDELSYDSLLDRRSRFIKKTSKDSSGNITHYGIEMIDYLNRTIDIVDNIPSVGYSSSPFFAIDTSIPSSVIKSLNSIDIDSKYIKRSSDGLSSNIIAFDINSNTKAESSLINHPLETPSFKYLNPNTVKVDFSPVQSTNDSVYTLISNTWNNIFSGNSSPTNLYSEFDLMVADMQIYNDESSLFEHINITGSRKYIHYRSKSSNYIETLSFTDENIIPSESIAVRNNLFNQQNTTINYLISKVNTKEPYEYEFSNLSNTSITLMEESSSKDILLNANINVRAKIDYSQWDGNPITLDIIARTKESNREIRYSNIPLNLSCGSGANYSGVNSSGVQCSCSNTNEYYSFTSCIPACNGGVWNNSTLTCDCTDPSFVYDPGGGPDGRGGTCSDPNSCPSDPYQINNETQCWNCNFEWYGYCEYPGGGGMDYF